MTVLNSCWTCVRIRSCGKAGNGCVRYTSCALLFMSGANPVALMRRSALSANMSRSNPVISFIPVRPVKLCQWKLGMLSRSRLKELASSKTSSSRLLNKRRLHRNHELAMVGPDPLTLNQKATADQLSNSLTTLASDCSTSLISVGPTRNLTRSWSRPN